MLMPVQWKGYESKLKRYQGELLDKKRVEQRYLDALNIPESLDDANLASMRAVLQPKNRSWKPHIKAQVFAKKGHVVRQVRGNNSPNG